MFVGKKWAFKEFRIVWFCNQKRINLNVCIAPCFAVQKQFLFFFREQKK